VHVKYLLPRSLSIGEEQVDPLALEPALPQSPSKALRNPEQVSARFYIQFGE
jgi:hypothetical protein